MIATAPARWTEHLRKHGPTDPELRALLLKLAEHADYAGRTGYTEDGKLVRVRLAPCQACGLGVDA